MAKAWEKRDQQETIPFSSCIQGKTDRWPKTPSHRKSAARPAPPIESFGLEGRFDIVFSGNESRQNQPVREVRAALGIDHFVHPLARQPGNQPSAKP
ncbi:MAG: hypothetical protein EXS32_09065 [Opitutus sp.]|nr:hypothetical protein [Opitutus sp.]